VEEFLSGMEYLIVELLDYQIVNRYEGYFLRSKNTITIQQSSNPTINKFNP